MSCRRLSIAMLLTLCLVASQVVVADTPSISAADHPYDCNLDEGVDECIDCCTAHAGLALANCTNAGLPLYLCQGLAATVLTDCVSRACEVGSQLDISESELAAE